MKKVVLVLFAFLFFSVGQAFAYRVTDFSTDAKIVAAMRVLTRHGVGGDGGGPARRVRPDTDGAEAGRQRHLHRDPGRQKRRGGADRRGEEGRP